MRLSSYWVWLSVGLGACGASHKGQTRAESNEVPAHSGDEASADAGAEPTANADLVTANAWRLQDAETDSLAHFTAEHVPCRESDTQVEGTAYEIETIECNFAIVSQPALENVARGERLEFTLWWQDLISAPPAIAHLALLIDDELLWEEELAVPGKADVRSLSFEAPRAFDQGALVQFHLHNHGYNNYKFGSLRRVTVDRDSDATSGTQP